MITITKIQFISFGALHGLVLIGDTLETLSEAANGELVVKAGDILVALFQVFG